MTRVDTPGFYDGPDMNIQASAIPNDIRRLISTAEFDLARCDLIPSIRYSPFTPLRPRPQPRNDEGAKRSTKKWEIRKVFFYFSTFSSFLVGVSTSAFSTSAGKRRRYMAVPHCISCSVALVMNFVAASSGAGPKGETSNLPLTFPDAFGRVRTFFGAFSFGRSFLVAPS